MAYRDKSEKTAALKAWRKANPEKVLIHKRTYRSKDKDKKAFLDRRLALRRKFNITMNQYDELLDKQNGVCAICKKPETTRDHRTGKIRQLAVDHCHTTGKVRGLLCGDHNRLIGQAEDSILILESAIKYLQRNI